MLNEGDPGEPWRYACGMVDISNPLNPSEPMIQPYEFWKRDGSFTYETTAGGFVFNFVVTSHRRESLFQTSIAVTETGDLKIPMFDSELRLEGIRKRLIR